MPKRRRPGSIFSALPSDLKYQLRSQPGLSDDPEPVSEARRPNPADLLPTQPPSEPSSSPVATLAELVKTEPSASESSTPARTSVRNGGTSGIVKSIKYEYTWPRYAEVEQPPKRIKTSATAWKGKGKARSKARAEDDEEEVVNLYEGHPWDCTGLVPRYTRPDQVPHNLKKYFYQRHSLFPAYSRLPLLMDDTGWFSVTPHALATSIAERCRSDVILDAFCGVGGNAIAFAQTCERVIAMDIDPIRLQLARHNALHHGVADRIEFVLCDYVQWAREYIAAGRGSREEIDVVFLSPPWGGVDYLTAGARTNGANSNANTAAEYSHASGLPYDADEGKKHTVPAPAPVGSNPSPFYPLSAIAPIHGRDLFDLTAQITPNIAYFLPRNVDLDEVATLAQRLPEAHFDGGVDETEERNREWVEVEEEWVGTKLKAVTCYYGALVDGA